MAGSTAARVLGIETSCDETAAAVVEDGRRILSNVVASQAEVHAPYGGVVPELASRHHVETIVPVVERAMSDAGTRFEELAAIAVTQGPGLVGSLLVGLQAAKAIALVHGKPLVPVHHVAGHVAAAFLAHGEIPLPAIALVVSGGHTSLFEVPEEGVHRRIGRTRDDAAGEAFDKVAKLLGLGYPGGPAIDRVARTGNDRAFDFPAARLTHADRNAPRATAEGILPADVARRVDFSFSGLKTAVLRLVRERTGTDPDIRALKAAVSDDAGAVLPASDVADIAASFQRTVVEALLDRTFEAARWLDARSIGISGGVSANSRLRAEAEARGARHGIPVFIPPIALSTDNAAMIGAAGLRKLRSDGAGELDFNAEASLALEG
jgi:N6-L-threonylcarbamoyladenine synthase